MSFISFSLAVVFIITFLQFTKTIIFVQFHSRGFTFVKYQKFKTINSVIQDVQKI